MTTLAKYCQSFGLYSALTFATASQGKGFFDEYSLGLTYSSTLSYANIAYDTPVTKTTPSNCSTDGAASNGQMRCQTYLSEDSSGAHSVGAFVEKKYERQGLFYFKPGFTLSTLSYTGGINNTKPNSPLPSQNKTTSTKSSAAGAPVVVTDTAPLTQAYIQMYGINWQYYLKVGFTPHFFPDIFLSGGLGIETVAGTVKVFKTVTNAYIIQPDAFGEAEIVFLRSSHGYMSGFGSLSNSLATPLGTNLIQDNPSGTQTTNYKLGLQKQELGARIAFSF